MEIMHRLEAPLLVEVEVEVEVEVGENWRDVK